MKIAADMKQKIEDSLDSIRPYLREDGGDVEVVELTDDQVLKVKFMGNCESCAMSFTTLKAGIEESVRRSIPEIKSIEAINI
jgi:Fe-S cluster biogenesis protein NfuA